MPIAYIIDSAETYKNACRVLSTVPPSDWLTPEDYNRVYIGVRLYEMEMGELENG